MFSPSQGSSFPNNSIPESWACLESRACQESRPPESRPGARLPSPRAPPRSLAPLASPGGPGHAPSGPFVRSSRGRPRTPLRCAGPSPLRRCCRVWNQNVAAWRRSHVGLRDLRRYLLAGVGGSRALPLSGFQTSCRNSRDYSNRRKRCFRKNYWISGSPTQSPNMSLSASICLALQ